MRESLKLREKRQERPCWSGSCRDAVVGPQVMKAEDGKEQLTSDDGERAALTMKPDPSRQELAHSRPDGHALDAEEEVQLLGSIVGRDWLYYYSWFAISPIDPQPETPAVGSTSEGATAPLGVPGHEQPLQGWDGFGVVTVGRPSSAAAGEIKQSTLKTLQLRSMTPAGQGSVSSPAALMKLLGQTLETQAGSQRADPDLPVGAAVGT